jgi:hypothetical protein
MAKTDTILAHCIARAVVAEAGGEEAAKAKYGEDAEGLKASRWQAFRVAAKVTPRASRVAAFISLWGLALDDLDRDELTVDEYAEWANEARATAFRRAADYRELWGSCAGRRTRSSLSPSRPSSVSRLIHAVRRLGHRLTCDTEAGSSLDVHALPRSGRGWRLLSADATAAGGGRRSARRRAL